MKNKEEIPNFYNTWAALGIYFCFQVLAKSTFYVAQP